MQNLHVIGKPTSIFPGPSNPIEHKAHGKQSTAEAEFLMALITEKLIICQHCSFGSQTVLSDKMSNNKCSEQSYVTGYESVCDN